MSRSSHPCRTKWLLYLILFVGLLPLWLDAQEASPPMAEPKTTEAEETDDVTCFIVNEEEIISEGEKPHVVCTSEPDDVSLLHALLHCGEYNFSYLFQHSHIIVFPYSMLIVDGCSMLGSTEWIQRK